MSTLEKALAADAVEEQCKLHSDLGWLLSKASFSLASEIGRAFGALGVSPRGYHVLSAAAQGELTQSELVEIVGLDKTTMVTTVDELEAAGFAERRPSERDRRARVIVVTAAGLEKIREGRATVERVQADVLDTLPTRQRAAFLEALGTLVEQRLSERMPCDPPLRRQRMRK